MARPRSSRFRALPGALLASVSVCLVAGVAWAASRAPTRPSRRRAPAVGDWGSHRALVGAGVGAPRDRASWAAALDALHARGVDFIDVDVNAGGGAGRVDDYLMGHPREDLARDSPAESASRLAFAPFLELVAERPWLRAGVELKPAAGGGGGGGGGDAAVLAQLIDAADAAGVGARVFFEVQRQQLSSALAAGVARAGAAGARRVALVLRARAARSPAEPAAPDDADCGLGDGATAVLPASAAVIMPAHSCLASPAVSRALRAWADTRAAAALPRGELWVWLVDAPADAERVRSWWREFGPGAPALTLISNVAAEMRALDADGGGGGGGDSGARR